MTKFFLIATLLFSLSCGQRPVKALRIPLVPGQCYYYHRLHTGIVFRETVNPFWYRYLGDRTKAQLIVEAYEIHKGQVYTSTLINGPRRLMAFSKPVPCSVVDSLSRISQPL